jgi:hypothetical protein
MGFRGQVSSHILLVAWMIGLITVNRPIDPVVAETTGKIFGEISRKDQQRNFFAGSITENAVADRKFASYFTVLYDQETIEWEQRGRSSGYCGGL